jgi:hypothetical protein
MLVTLLKVTIGFGFGVGDLITVLQLTNQIVSSLLMPFISAPKQYQHVCPLLARQVGYGLRIAAPVLTHSSSAPPMLPRQSGRYCFSFTHSVMYCSTVEVVTTSLVGRCGAKGRLESG